MPKGKPTEKINALPDTFWAYLAGLTDGDGSFKLSLNKPRYPHLRRQFIPSIIIGQNDLGVLNYIKEKVGAGFTYTQKANKRRKNDKSCLKFHQRVAYLVLPHILPYLLIKKEKAKLLYEAVKIIQKGQRFGSKSRPDWEYQKLLEISEKIKQTENAMKPVDVKVQKIVQKNLRFQE